jgi:hypothetical protein
MGSATACPNTTYKTRELQVQAEERHTRVRAKQRDYDRHKNVARGDGGATE